MLVHGVHSSRNLVIVAGLVLFICSHAGDSIRETKPGGLIILLPLMSRLLSNPHSIHTFRTALACSRSESSCEFSTLETC